MTVAGPGVGWVDWRGGGEGVGELGEGRGRGGGEWEPGSEGGGEEEKWRSKVRRRSG